MKVTSATIALLVVLAPLVAGVPAVVVGSDAGEPGGAMAAMPGLGQMAAGANQADNGSTVGLGESISSFMQASAADANASVDNGMFEARFERSNASDRPTLVQKRTEKLQIRLEQLRQERQEILASTEDGDLTVSERARVARLTARIQGLERAIEQTETAAQRAGINPPGLSQVREETRNMTGPRVHTGLDDIDRRNSSDDRPGAGPGNRGDGGPPGDDQGDGRDGGNESDGPPGQSDGPGNADNRSEGDGSGNETDGGDGADSGNETDGGDGADSGNETDDGDGADSGNETDDGDGADSGNETGGVGDGDGNESDGRPHIAA